MKNYRELMWERDDPLIKGGRHHKVPDGSSNEPGNKGVANTPRKVIDGRK